MKVELVGVDIGSVPSVRNLLESQSQFGLVDNFLTAVRGEFLQGGYMVDQVLIDGEIYDGTTMAVRRVDAPQSAEIVVSRTDEFVGDTFQECSDAIVKLVELKDDITGDVRSGSVVRASENLYEFADGLSVVLTAYQDGVHLLARVGLANHDELDKSLVRMRKLHGVLKDVLDGIQHRDFVLISNALQFEFSEQLEQMRQEFAAWSRRLSEAQATAVPENEAELATE